MSSLRLRSVAAAAVALILVARTAPAQTAPPASGVNAAAAGQPAYKFVLDYDVPDSPGFVALDVSPEKVLTGSAAKPVVVNLLEQAAQGGKLDAGLALDFSPYFLAGGRFQNINEYRTHPIKRLLANTTVSFASVQDAEDSSAMRFGAGIRLTVFDDHDPLQNDRILQRVEQILSGGAMTPGRPKPRVQNSVTVPGLADAYAAAIDTLRATPGRALAIGWGISGTLRNAVLSPDSVTHTRHRFWAGYRETFTGGWEFLGALLVGGPAGSQHDYRLGGALRTNAPGFRLTGEAVYESVTRQLHPGGVAEFKVLPQIDAVVSLRSEPDDQGVDASKLRFRTMLRWNMSQGAGAK
jgi:hypothetical protein